LYITLLGHSEVSSWCSTVPGKATAEWVLPDASRPARLWSRRTPRW